MIKSVLKQFSIFLFFYFRLKKNFILNNRSKISKILL